MKVNLINWTSAAMETLIYTKGTRLQHEVSFADITNMPYEEKLDELRYMRDTIKSSWEFVDYIFEIKGVTRAFTHQLVRTRTGAFAQESQRTVDVRNSNVINTSGDNFFDVIAKGVIDDYGRMIDRGTPVQDARGILPTNIETSIIAKFNLRTLHEMGLLRLCVRTQGEYQRVFKAMIEEVFKVHPWSKEFIKVKCAWDGVCAFPRYTECPIQSITIAVSEDYKAAIEEAWSDLQYEANPKAKNGRTM